jgi:hypothetical protein
MKRTTLLLALAALATLVFASVAEAHFLSFKRARNATFNIAREDCNRINTCDRFSASDCVRLSAHKVRCRETLYGENRRGTYELRIQVTVSIREGSDDRYYKQSNASCTGAGC